VSASFQFFAEASWTTITLLPSRAMRLTPMPLRSRFAFKSSAARSAWLATAFSVSTPRTRWMPPCKSRPRLIVFFGGYTYQREPTTTAATRAILTQTRLGIFLRHSLHHHPGDRAPIELELDLVGDAQRDGVLVQARHRPVEPARSDDTVSLLERPQHLF